MRAVSLERRRHQYAVVAHAIEFIRDNALRQPSLAEVADAVNMSEFHLQRVFAGWAGISPKRFLQYVTKEHARRALRASADVLQVALSSGLSGPGRLHDLMVSCEAMTPGEIKALGKGVCVRMGVAPTPFGDAMFGWTARGVCFLAFCDDDLDARLRELEALWPAAQLQRDDREAGRLSARVFPAGARPGRLHLLLRGTNFQLKVWEALLSTRPSQLISYGKLAAQAGSSAAQRAVGNALAANHVAFLIPCHRVIRETGDLGSYRWGSTRKAAILAWEAGRGEERPRQAA